MDSPFDRRRSVISSQARTSRWLLTLFYLLYFASGLFTLQVILFKTVPFSAIFYHAGVRSIRSINWIPFYTIAEFFTSRDIGIGRAFINVGGNIAIFVPLGILAAQIGNGKSFRMQSLWLLIASLLLEIIQYVLALGSSDIDDILLNTLGGVIGIGIYRWFRKKTATTNRLLTALIALFLVVGFAVGASAKMLGYDSLLPFSNARVGFVDENKEVMAGWDEVRPDLFGNLTAVGTQELTVHVNPKHRQTSEPTEAEGQEVRIPITDATKFFISHIRSHKHTVISDYQEATNSEIVSLLETRDMAPPVKVWLSSDDRQVAEAVLVSVVE
ncbi:MAG: VanZ family protein [Paenibacillus sp.]|uniref:VanZ family protein n=1 Tax=Paenibacillus sp. TaxID=58172 RepID=UPI0028FF6693|nr:VanZ family protein [Paenibacillus sp.]MDU2241630.1 VanZ family protein [Paenibacillus sp.]